jgi:hypothetical protein
MGARRWSFNTRFVVGRQDNPMLERWRLVQTPWFGVYVHFIFREDLDPVPHDHPWRFRSIILRGGYVEEFHERPGHTAPEFREHRAGRSHAFPLHNAHRITQVVPGTVTLIFVGPKVRSWGFYENGSQWVDYRDASGQRPTEGVSA